MSLTIHVSRAPEVPSIKLGLFYDNELVAVMGLGKSKFNSNYEYEIYYDENRGYPRSNRAISRIFDFRNA